MLKDKLVILKEHIHIKRRQFSAYQDMKALLGPNDLMFQFDFAESYKNDQQDAIQSAYLGNQCSSFFTACCYVNVEGVIKNQNVVILTERSEHDRVASMSCLQNVVEIELKNGKSYENLHLWSDGMRAQFRSPFMFQILAYAIFQEKHLVWCYHKRHHGKGCWWNSKKRYF